MDRIERVRMVAEQQGVSLAEYLVLHISTAFAMTAEEAGGFVTKSLQKSAYADVDGAAAVQSCIVKGWVGFSPSGRLILVGAGLNLAHAISAELTTPPSGG
ncbi:hypothetical protein AYO40_03210 [Planctomycetaceae bacterium SCGC AG-212-D15]|nr:hypothetical protein AYO40_03210 [Planctomycetaceae bacterium SCGC AG-212-D15]